jgi:peptidyl-prolyl cis-trans isomerase C
MRCFNLRGAALAVPALLLAVFAADPAASQSTESAVDLTAIDQSQVVAKVNGTEITVGYVIQLVESLPEQYRQIPLQVIYPELVRQLVNQQLIADAARAENYLDDPEVQARLAFVEQRVLQDIYFTRALESGLTEERLRARYEEEYLNAPPTVEVHARHILIESKEEAEAIIVELSEGADFAELAKERSTGPSGPSGGDLGFFTKEQMVPEFAEAAFALEVGAHTTEPVQTTYGWHVILVEERRDQEPPSFEESVDQIRNEAAGEMVTEMVDNLREAAEIEEFDLEGAPLDGGE